MRYLRLFEDFDKKYAVIGKWTVPDENDGKEQWDILSGPTSVTYDDAIRIKKGANKAWIDNAFNVDMVHNEFIITWDEYQKMLSEEPGYQKDISEKFNL